ncbi:MAG: thioredoxin domain-containing protein [Tannerellaceae bacterium]|nr:thioredoxin domain-containing protein [Tannerellaceae bacterium]
MKDKEKDIKDLQLPFIAHVSDDFRIVSKVGPEYVETIWRGRPLKTPVKEFLDIWSGIVLMLESDPSSIEPGYAVNRKKELFDVVQKAFLVLLLSLCLLLPFVLGGLYKDLWKSFLLFFNLAGVGICFLLVQKQLHIRSEYADRICSLFSESDCNNVLESDVAKFMGVIGWSEAGLGYFISNTIVLLFFPGLIPFLVFINICALPYSFWSVWYQKVKAKQWCPLCLIVQGLFWSIFSVNILAGQIEMPEVNLVDLLSLGCVYFIPFLLLNIFVPRLSENRKTEQTSQELSSLKADEDVFAALLKKQPYYKTGINSDIVFGNPEGNISLTILTNPHCAPCSKMNERVKIVLAKNNHLKMQYIFSSFREDMDISNKFMIAAYYLKGKEQAERIYDEWFEKGKNEAQAFFGKYDFDPLHLPVEVEAEFLKHEKWKELTRLRETPTILVNGYKLPKNYSIEDIRFITKLSV